MTDDEEIVVVGAGAVGLACAHALATSGSRPLVVDADEPGAGSSWGNAGWVAIAPPIVAPLPGPGVIGTSLRWLARRHSPLRLVPRLDLEYARWLLRFTASCTSRAAEAGLRAVQDLNAESGELFEKLERDGLDVELQRGGVLLVHRTRESLEAARKKLGAGDEGRLLSRDEAVAAEPLLRPEACAGAIRYETDRQVRPEKLVGALAGRLAQLGVEIRTGCRCTGVIRDGRRVTGIRTPQGTIRARAVVLAAGVGVRALARDAGVRVPVEGGRGYSFDVPRDELPINLPLYLYDDRVGLTPFRNSTRVAGHMELGARTATVRPQAIETMNRAGAAALRAWPAGDPRDAWAGLRPVTPDGLPVIGAAPGVENLYLAGGHGMLGVTLSLRTGRAIAAMVGGGAADPVLRPFSPVRF